MLCMLRLHGGAGASRGWRHSEFLYFQAGRWQQPAHALLPPLQACATSRLGARSLPLLHAHFEGGGPPVVNSTE